jgi:hypothetical protein
MELRYMGFDQAREKRVYKFDCTEKGTLTNKVQIAVAMELFLKHHVNIQEGPSLCARKLTADLLTSREGDHELTDEDLQAYTADRAAAEARRAESRKPGPRRKKVDPGQTVSPWWR